MHASPVPVTVLSAASAATIAWCARAALHLTVVVKATFALVPEARMSLVEPDPIAFGEEQDRSGVGLRTAGDLAPYLGQAEAWLTGHAEIARLASQGIVHVQLAVVQGGAVRVNKHVDLHVAPDAGVRSRVVIAGMGPIARDWPQRRRWLEGLDPRGLERPVLDVPEGLHWEYFQTAPLDQRLDALRGDEWVVLGGMILGRPRFRTQLPAVRGAARLYRRSNTPPRASEPVVLHADMLQVDVDRRRCSIVWRGHVELKRDDDLDSLHVVAGLEQPGQDLAWVNPFQDEANRRAAVATPFERPTAPAVENLFGETVSLPDDVGKKLVAAVLATPFQKPNTPVVENLFGETVSLPEDVGKKLAAVAVATPFEKPGTPAVEGLLSESKALSGGGGEKLVATPATPFEKSFYDGAASGSKPRVPAELSAPAAENLLGETVSLSDDVGKKPMAAPTTPFEKGREGGDVALSLGETLDLPDLSAMRLAGVLGTPFEALPSRSRPVAGSTGSQLTVTDPLLHEPPEKRAAPEAPFAHATRVSSVDRPEAFATAPASPFWTRPAARMDPVGSPVSEARSAVPEYSGLAPDGLGAAFLAAMRRHRSRQA